MKGSTSDGPIVAYAGADERRSLLTSLVRERGYLSAVELAQMFGVSEMTIRRDIRKLADQGLVRDVHGGVSMATQSAGRVAGFADRFDQHHAAKAAIGQAGAARVGPGSVVGLDAGTTTFAVAQELLPGADLSVVTVSIPALAVLAEKQIPTLILGGAFRPDMQSIALRSTGPDPDLRIDDLFLSASAVIDGAVYTGSDGDARTKQTLIAMARRVILVADASKFVAPKSAMFRVIDLAKLNLIVTDWSLPEHGAQQIPDSVEVSYADRPTDEPQALTISNMGC
jgi:DeoR/GlpR family transcriptional regulator of sugar metabolism